MVIKKFYVYFLRRPDKPDPFELEKGQPFYIGKGNSMRYLEHRKEAKFLYRKFGKKSYKVTIILFLWKLGLDYEEDILFNNLTEQEAFEIEQIAIKAYGRKNNGTGILSNLTDGGEGSSGIIVSKKTRVKLSISHKGKNFSEEHRKKLSEYRKNNPLSFESIQKMRRTLTGRKLSEEHKQKIKETSSGRNHSEETKKRLSESKMGINNPQYGKSHPFYGRGFHTEETKQKMSKTRIGHHVSEKTKQKISQAQKGENNHQFGKPLLEETKQKISLALSGRKLSEEHKRNLSKARKRQNANSY